MANCLRGKVPPKKPETSKVIIGNRGYIGTTPIYPQETSHNPDFKTNINQMLAENEWLKQELFYDQNSEINRLVNSVQKHEVTLSVFVTVINQIHTLTGIKKQDIYGIVYNTFSASYNTTYVNFKDKRHHESKLKFLWRMGYLPHVYFVAKGMLDGLRVLFKYAPAESKILNSAVQSKIDKGKPKSTKPQPTLPF